MGIRQLFFYSLPVFLVGLLWVSPQFIGARWDINQASAQDSVAKMKSREEEIRTLMISWSEQLSVTCNECHNVNNFKDSSKKSFKISIEHARIVQLLRQNGFNGKTQREASCTTCHMGQLKPPTSFPKRPVSPTTSIPTTTTTK